MNNVQTSPKIKKETKNKIKVDFERTPLSERLKGKFFSTYFLGRVIWFIFRLLLLLGLSYIILFPFFTKISSSFMSAEDYVDVTVRLIPKYPTLQNYAAIIRDNDYFKAMLNTFILSFTCAVIQTFICCLIAYGFAKFKFKGSKILFMLVILTMIIPHSTLQLSMFMKFKNFDILGLIQLFTGSASPISFINSNIPLYMLSITGLAFKNGLYIFLLRQFFKGLPNEFEESAYLDGCGTFRTFVQIILPNSVAMLITVFMFAFSWQWTDNYYTTLFYTTTGPALLPGVIKVPSSMQNEMMTNLQQAGILNTAGLMIIIPLVILYVFMQRYIVQGIERSGITGD